MPREGIIWQVSSSAFLYDAITISSRDAYPIRLSTDINDYQHWDKWYVRALCGHQMIT